MAVSAVRTAFMDAVNASRAVLASPQVASRWTDPSALAEFSVGGLAGHLVRGSTTVLEYLAASDPEGEPIRPAAYFAAMPAAPDLASPLPVSIRQRGEQLAAAGPAGLLDRLDTARSELVGLLPTLSDSRKVQVFGNQVMRLDDYLLTRIVELLTHTDDLAVSLGLAPIELPASALDLALPYLLEVGRLRSGDLAVLRAFTRRERDLAGALRIF